MIYFLIFLVLLLAVHGVCSELKVKQLKAELKTSHHWLGTEEQANRRHTMRLFDLENRLDALCLGIQHHRIEINHHDWSADDRLYRLLQQSCDSIDEKAATKEGKHEHSAAARYRPGRCSTR